MLLRFPDPYDFVLSTERFRVFGRDLANPWTTVRSIASSRGREVRIVAAPGGVEVEPLDDETRAGRREAARPRVRPRPVHRLGRPSEPVLAEIVARLAGLRPPLCPDPFESLVTSITAQQVSLRSAFAIRNRMIERLRRAAPAARTRSRRAQRVAAASEASWSRSASRAGRPST